MLGQSREVIASHAPAISRCHKRSSRCHKRPGQCHRRRGAYILFVVLSFVAVATALGLAFLDANSTVMPEAVNYNGAVRAQYQAGSGVAMAEHYIMYPPTTVASNFASNVSYWTGANNISVDGSVNYCNVAVLRSDGWSPALTDLNRYRITATGVACDANAAVRAKKTVTVDVQAPLTQKWQFPYEYFSNGAISIPSQVTVYGNIQSNASLTGTGFCNGKLSAATTCTWTGTGPPTSITPLAPAYTPYPSANPALYSSYTILGRTYTAYTGFASSTMLSSDATALNAIDMSATNPGRVIIAPTGDFRVRGGVSLNGTLVVSGRCQFDDAGAHAITAVMNFPAVVASGNIQMLANNMTVTLVGPVICGGKLDNNTRTGTVVNVTGPGIIAVDLTGLKPDSQLTFTYSAQRAVFWDFENPKVIAPQPITVLSWKEN